MKGQSFATIRSEIIDQAWQVHDRIREIQTLLHTYDLQPTEPDADAILRRWRSFSFYLERIHEVAYECQEDFDHLQDAQSVAVFTDPISCLHLAGE